MAESSNDLLVRLQLIVESIDQVERAAAAIEKLSSIQGDTIVESVQFDIQGLREAQSAFEGARSVQGETAKKLEQSVTALEKYANTLKEIQERFGRLTIRKEALEGLRAVSEAAVQNKNKVPDDLFEFFSSARSGVTNAEEISAKERASFDKLFNDLQLGKAKTVLPQVEEGLKRINAAIAETTQQLAEAEINAKDAESQLISLAQKFKAEAESGSRRAPEAPLRKSTGGFTAQSGEVDAAKRSLSNYSDEIQQLIGVLASLPDRLEEATDRNLQAIQSLVNEIAKLETSFASLAKSSNAYVTQLKALTKLQREHTTVVQGFAQQPQQDMEDLGDSTAFYSTQMERATKSSIGFASYTNQSASASRNLADTMGRVDLEIRNATQGTIGFGRAQQQAAAQTNKTTTAGNNQAKTATKNISNFTSAFQLLLTDRSKFFKVFEFALGRLSIYALAAGAVYSVISAFKQAISEAVRFEEVLSQIQGVLPSRSEYSADIIGQAAVRTAQQFGIALSEAAEAAKTFAQTGRSVTQITRDIEAAFLAVRGANLNVEQAKDLIIAIENITNGELEAMAVLDRISRVESRRAITAQDLAVGFQRLGPVVRQLSGDMSGLIDEYDVAAGALTTIVERTRVTGTAAATSLRFILARLGQPDIVGRVQELAGVGLAREGGRELRPFVEILEELSLAYQKLKGTAAGFELLAVIGGARQIQATATLLENFSGTTLETARISATAFNDSAERTAIALDNIANSARQAGVSWTSFATALIESEAVSEGIQLTFEAIGGIGNVLAGTVRIVNELGADLAEIFTGRSRFAFVPPDLSDIKPEQLTRVRQLGDVAQSAGLSVSELTKTLEELAAGITSDLSDRFGLPFEEIVDQLSSGKAGNKFRGLRETIGEKLADAIQESTNALDEYQEALDSASTESERSVAASNRVAAAFNIVGNAIFNSVAVLDLVNDKIVESTNSTFEQLITGYSKTAAQLRDDNFAELFGIGNARVKPIRFGLDTDISTLEKFIDFADKIRAAEGIKNVEGDLTSLTDVLYESALTADLWRESLERAFESTEQLSAGQRLLRAQDIFTTAIRGAENYKDVVESLSDEIIRILNLDDQAGVAASGLLGSTVGSAAINNQALIFSDVVNNIRTSRTLGAQSIQQLQQLEKAFNSALAAQSAMVTTASKSYAKLNQDLLNIFVTFTETINATKELDVIYGDLGITFDAAAQRFAATKSLLEGLISLPSKLTGEAARLFNQLQEAQDKGSTSEGSLAESLGEGLAAAVLSSEDLSQALEIANRNSDQLKATYESLASQIRSMDTVDLRAVFGASPEGRQLLEDFRSILQSNSGELLDQVVAMATIINRAINLLSIEENIRKEREISTRLLKAETDTILSQADAGYQRRARLLDSELALQRSSLEINRQLLEITGDRSDALAFQIESLEQLTTTELRNARASSDDKIARANLQYTRDLARIEQDIANEKIGASDAEVQRLEALITLQSTLTQLEQDQIDLTLEKLAQLDQQKQDLASSRILETFKALNQQVQQNIGQASSGIRTLLRDYDSLKRDSLTTLLSPIADTYLDRIAENFTASLFDATKDDFFGKVAQAYGSGPEQRLREQLQNSFIQGASVLGTEFDSFVLRLSTVLETYFPGANVPAFTPRDTPVPENTSRTRGLIEQLAFLAAVQGGTALGAKLGGNQANASLGAGVGGTASTLLLTGVLGAAAGPVGALLGGLLGGAIGKDDDEKQRQEEELQALNRIEYNTDRTATELELERQFRDIQRGAINVPSSFTLPSYTPFAGGQVTQSNEINIEVVVQNPTNGQEVIASITTELGPALTDELRKLGL